MDNNKKNPVKKSFNQPAAHNDQLGENASEEFKSEKYTNSGDVKEKCDKRV